MSQQSNIPLPRSLTESQIVSLLLIAAVGFNFITFAPEAAIPTPYLNDSVLHILALEQTVQALRTGHDPTDFWLAPIVMGYPLPHHYQHLAYVFPALLYLPLQNVLTVAQFYRWLLVVLWSIFPLSIYVSMRRFGFSTLAAGLSGLIASLLSSNGLYGFEAGSYAWRGFGLYTQLWAMIFMPLALGQGYAAIRDGQGFALSALLLAATLLSHLVMGYITTLSLYLLVILPVLGSPEEARPETVGRRLARLLLILALCGLVTAYFFCPFLVDRTYLNRSVWEAQSKYDSLGHQAVLDSLLRGETFDHDRLPILTVLIGVGLAIGILRWREEQSRFLVVLFGTWLLLYFGRPTWGALLDLLPLSHDLHLHRFSAGVHLAGIYLAGTALSAIWLVVVGSPRAKSNTRGHLPHPVGKDKLAIRIRRRERVWVALLLTALLVTSLFAERSSFLAQNAAWLREGMADYIAERADFEALLAKLHELPAGRVYAGLGANWGARFRVGFAPVYALLTGHGVDTVGYAYHALSLNADAMLAFDETRIDHYDLFGVRYTVGPPDHTFPYWVRPVQRFGRFWLYETSASGLSEVVPTGPTYAGDRQTFSQAMLGWMGRPRQPLTPHPIVILVGKEVGSDPAVRPLSELAGADPFPSPDRPLGRVLEENTGPGSYSVRVAIIRPSMLMLKVTYHPGWHVAVNGEAVQPVMLMPSYLGVPLEVGEHEVHFDYRPEPLRAPLMIGGLLSTLLITLGEWQIERLWPWLHRAGLRLPIAPRG